MLKITVEDSEGPTRFKVEGRLAGPWVAELERSWGANFRRQGATVDISEVTFIDAEGRKLLARMHSEGAELLAQGCMNRCIVEEIERGKVKVSPSNMPGLGKGE